MSFVIFLDIDGVLNSRSTVERTPSGISRGVDDRRVEILGKTMRECLVDGVVLTTTWKIMRPDSQDFLYLKGALEKHGVKILGKTTDPGFAPRGVGIRDYLEQNPDIDEFVIIDDQKFDYEDDNKLWENFIDTRKNGIESAVAAAKTPTVTVLDFLDVLEKYSK